MSMKKKKLMSMKKKMSKDSLASRKIFT